MRSRSLDLVRDTGRQLWLLDSCVLVDTLRGYDPAQAWLEDTACRYDVHMTCSVVTFAELIAGAQTEQLMAAVRRLMDLARTIPVDDGVAERAGAYLRAWHHSHGVRMPDALIAATAAEFGATIVTRDKAHFPMDDVRVLVPY